jgi:branched-chain amino acid transport system permease protein
MVTIKAFAVVLVGGLDSLRGVVPGALIVAAAELLTVNFLGPQLAEAAPFVVLLVALSIRPWGLFGTHEELRRV